MNLGYSFDEPQLQRLLMRVFIHPIQLFASDLLSVQLKCPASYPNTVLLQLIRKTLVPDVAEYF